MNNYNRKSIRIIKSWYKLAQKPVKSPNDYFDRFISLWISFNAFFVAEFHEKARKLAKGNDPWEKKYLEAIYSENSENSYYNRYINLIEDSKIFSKNLYYFMKLLEDTMCPGHIADMRRERRNCDYAQEFSDLNNFEQFILTAYQIRCNLFHGNKHPESDDDIEIVKTMFNLLTEFLTEIYKEEGYLNDQ